LKYLCKTAVDWVNRIVTISGNSIIKYTFYYEHLWKGKFMAGEPGKLAEFLFSYFVATLLKTVFGVDFHILMILMVLCKRTRPV